MKVISAILSNIAHRPYELPAGPWKYYQEWNNALFLHWAIPFDTLRKYVPEQFHIDSYNGTCYISLVAFTMQKIRPRNLPAVKFISDFHEINLRTYIDQDNKKGVYFLNIEAQKYLSTFIAKNLSGLPYEKSLIKRTDNTYTSKNNIKEFFLDTAFEVNKKLVNKSDLDRWLTERYCLYLDKAGKSFRYDIHHKEWELNNVAIKSLSLNYTIGEINLFNKNPDLVHYSDGVKVVAWAREKL